MITFIHSNYSITVPHVAAHEKRDIFRDHIAQYGKGFIALEGPVDHRAVRQAQCKVSGKPFHGDLIEAAVERQGINV